MLRPRVIPTLLLRAGSLVKTVRFGRFAYIGDPINTVRIFNELEVDELVILDISVTRSRGQPDLPLLADIASECFMPLAYGGGIQDLEQARAILQMGFEKVIVNTQAVRYPRLLTLLSDELGSQAVVASIDVKRTRMGRPTVVADSASQNTGMDPIAWAVEAASRGAGEILLTAVDREGTWQGYDLELVRAVSNAVSVPVIANGGAADVNDIAMAVNIGGASAAAVGSMVMFQKQGAGVLINFPPPERLAQALAK